MSNPIFDAMGNIPFGGNNDFFSQLQQFKQQMQGINPKDEVMKKLQNGKISQQQLNQAQQMAQQMQHMFRQ